MNKSTRRGLLAAVLVAVATPALAQFSDGFTFLKAVRERDSNKVAEIVANSSSTAIHTRDRATGEGALHIVVRGRDLTWLNFLLARRARPDLADNDGNTALTIAAQIGWVEGAEALLARRANVNAANARGETPLIMAVHRRDPAMVRLLMGNGADPNWTDSAAGLSAIDYARRDTRAGQVLRLLQLPRTPRPAAAGPTRP